jgi:hypothetical protein
MKKYVKYKLHLELKGTMTSRDESDDRPAGFLKVGNVQQLSSCTISRKAAL